jgi:membrane associated rhomboid family serine protease
MRYPLCYATFLPGALLALTEWRRPLTRAAGARAIGNQLLLDAFGGVLLVCGCLVLLAMVRKLPRLIADRQGITIRTLFTQQSRCWSELGPFRLVPVGPRKFRAIAQVAATADSARPPRPFVIDDRFDSPLPDILQDIAVARGEAVEIVDTTPVRPIGLPGFRWPWLSLAMLGLFGLVFAVEIMAPVRPAIGDTPSVITLAYLGALNPVLVGQGQVYRLLSAVFLHASAAHLLLNGIAFMLGGYWLERLVGRSWTFGIFILGGLAGSALSLALLPSNVVGVGASGGIMAMLTCLAIISFRLPAGRQRERIWWRCGRITIPALIPVSMDGSALHIDYGAHFGGALLGVGLGLVLLKTWRADSPLRRWPG